MTADWKESILRLGRRAAGSRLLPLILAVWGIAVVSYGYGDFARANHLFPSQQLDRTRDTFKELIRIAMWWQPHYPYIASAERRTLALHDRGAVAPGMTLISGLGGDDRLF